MADGYVRGIALGEGTWGLVYEATRRADGRRVAIKRIKPMEPQFGINFTALREIKHLQELHSVNIVNLIEVFFSGGVLHLVLEFCPHDLEKVIRDKTIVLKAADVKCYMGMMLRGIECCHKHYVLHRDLKPANLLIDQAGVLKLADFGLARSHGSPEKLTSEVVTRWYRAPELLFGAPMYGAGVDMWAVGCIFAELIFRVPLFPGDSDLEQLGKIFNVLGTPSDLTWPNARLLPAYVQFEERAPMSLAPLFRASAASGRGPPADLDLLLRMLTLNPAKRITATESLAHPYFGMEPLACQPGDLQLPVSDKKQQVKAVLSDSAADNDDSGQHDSKRMKIA